MTTMTMTRRSLLLSGLAASAGIGAGFGSRAFAQSGQTFNLISHRYPALEYFAKVFEKAIPGVTVQPSLMTRDRAAELTTLNLSRGSDAYDIIWVDDALLLKYAKNDWLEPLDDLWAKYKAEFKFDDFDETVLDTMRLNGRLYAIPFEVNVQMLFYRGDVLKGAGVKPPANVADFVAAAKNLNKPPMAGVSLGLKPVDSALNAIHYHFTTNNVAWFDDKWKPAFNSPAGVAAMQQLKDLTQFSQKGYTAAANDETAFAMQQNLAAMGLLWASRAQSMDDPQKSNAVGKVDWAPVPGGGGRMSGSGYAVSKFTKRDKDLVFRTIATASTTENLKGAAGISIASRRSVLAEPSLQEKFRFYGAALAAMKVNRTFPKLPEFDEIGEIITRNILQGVTGEKEVKASLDAAASEVTAALGTRGYYR